MTPKSLADASRGDERPAQWEAGEPEHNRVSKDPDGTPAHGVRERPGETDQAKRAARDQTGPGLGATRESWDSEQEREAEENVPSDNVDRVQHRRPLEVEDPVVSGNRCMVDVPSDCQFNEVRGARGRHKEIELAAHE